MKNGRTIDSRLTTIMTELFDTAVTLQQVMAATERKALTVALDKTRRRNSRGRVIANVTEAARTLGVHRNTVMNLCKKHGVSTR